ncbi:hypothetical protein FDENT_2927 [Fusarium denticulatum]|uniref:Alpha/beta hydrolase fold-3 domain-containing protein n=1 Tax=Fusarium denticulatum TaxID=48507 RepID=A0A8H5XEU6_9HYPO|nr:hypothetical protein FDENT_2927 [Fusarium denticulatum]
MASNPAVPIDEFNVATFTYKVIEGQPVLVDLFVPKGLPSGKRPVLVLFHGGFLVYGSRNNIQLTAPRIIEYALENNAILVSCDYRLLAESTGVEILEDIADVWSWVQSSLGEAIQTMTDGNSPRTWVGFCWLARVQHLKHLPDGPQPTTRAISNLPIAMVQHGTCTSFFGDYRSLFPIECLEDNPQLALELPFIWLHHGNDDSEVLIEGSRKFVAKLRELNPKSKLRYTELEGAEHGFWSEVNLIQSGEWEEGVKVFNTYLFN